MVRMVVLDDPKAVGTEKLPNAFSDTETDLIEPRTRAREKLKDSGDESRNVHRNETAEIELQRSQARSMLNEQRKQRRELKNRVSLSRRRPVS